MPREAMILCLHAPDRRRLDLLAASPDLRLSETPYVARLGPIGRLHFGVSFCQHLLPSPEDVQAASMFARDRGLGLSLVSSYVTDAFLARFLPLLDLLMAAPDPELIVEDWGLLRAARRRHPGLRIVLGRGLNRMVRDPRVPDTGPEHLGGDALPEAWRASALGSLAFRALLRRLGVARAETDVPLQGLNPRAGGEQEPTTTADPFPTAVHLPWGMVATGRICMVSAYGKPPSVRFLPPLSCDAPCRQTMLTLRAPWSRREEGGESLPVPEGAFIPLSKLLNRRRNELPPPEVDPAPRFVQKGNTHFYELAGERLAAALAWAAAEPGVDRLVISPDVPI